MSTYTRNLIAETGMLVGMGYKATTAIGEETLVKNLKNVALFFAAPFIGLTYLLAFPVVGLALVVWIAVKAAMKNEKARPIALAIAAPFMAIAFVTVGPIVALAALARIGAGALLNE